MIAAVPGVSPMISLPQALAAHESSQQQQQQQQQQHLSKKSRMDAPLRIDTRESVKVREFLLCDFHEFLVFGTRSFLSSLRRQWINVPFYCSLLCFLDFLKIIAVMVIFLLVFDRLCDVPSLCFLLMKFPAAWFKSGTGTRTFRLVWRNLKRNLETVVPNSWSGGQEFEPRHLFPAISFYSFYLVF